MYSGNWPHFFLVLCVHCVCFHSLSSLCHVMLRKNRQHDYEHGRQTAEKRVMVIQLRFKLPPVKHPLVVDTNIVAFREMSKRSAKCEEGKEEL